MARRGSCRTPGAHTEPARRGQRRSGGSSRESFSATAITRRTHEVERIFRSELFDMIKIAS